MDDVHVRPDVHSPPPGDTPLPAPDTAQLAGHMARLSGLRVRNELDLQLATSVFELFHPKRAGVFKTTAVDAEQLWSTRALVSADVRYYANGDYSDEQFADDPYAQHPLRILAATGQIAEGMTADGFVAVFPLGSGAHNIGVMEVITAEPLSQQDANLIQDVLKVYGNVNGLLDYGERDMLTALLNRKTFDAMFFENLSPGIQRIAPQVDRREAAVGSGVWVGVIDVDHFKLVNDRFGHLIGDEVLVLLAGLMKSTFRVDDGLFRFGGEEFVVLLRNLTEDNAHKAFERFRAKVESTRFPQIETLTVSVGFAEVRAADSPSAVLGRADQAVYHAKHHGRNQVHSHAALVSARTLTTNDQVGEIEIF